MPGANVILPHLRTLSLEQLTKLAGTIGSAFTLIKAAAGAAQERSLSRTLSKTIESIDATLTRVAQLGKPELASIAPALQPYRTQLEQDLQVKLQTLEKLQQKKRALDAARNQEPTGIHKWLLLYRPEGFPGLLVQSLYYLCVLLLALVAVLVPVGVLRHQLPIGDLALSLVMLVYIFPALYFRNIALRLKKIGNAVRLGSALKPNCDLSSPRRNLLLLHKGENWWVRRSFFYLFVVTAVAGLVDPAMSGPDTTLAQRISTSLICLWIAKIIQLDVLSRRALAQMATTPPLPLIAVPPPASIPPPPAIQ